MLDGADANQVSDNLAAYQPSPDAIQEMRVITQNASAEFGNFQGGVINLVIKSGANQYHGNLFESFRNDKLNADNWARNWSGLARTPIRWNQFGGTIGGRIKRDKLFFFADYQGFRQATPNSLSVTSVFQTAWRTGNFSNLLTSTYRKRSSTTHFPLTKGQPRSVPQQPDSDGYVRSCRGEAVRGHLRIPCKAPPGPAATPPLCHAHKTNADQGDFQSGLEAESEGLHDLPLLRRRPGLSRVQHLHFAVPAVPDRSV